MIWAIATIIVLGILIAIFQPPGYAPNVALGADAAAKAEPAPEKPPTFSERLAAMGIMPAVNARSIPEEPKDIGRLAAVMPNASITGGSCPYCDAENITSAFTLYEIVRKEPKSGARDLGLAEKCLLGKFCCNCGLTEKIAQNSAILGELYVKHENLLDLIEELERDGAGLPREKRKAFLSQKIAALDIERQSIAKELASL